jgi:aminomethyltransferase
MSAFASAIRHTAFHTRTAAHNAENRWCTRGGFTIPAAYGDPAQEVLAAHVSAVLCDISAEQRLRMHGAGVAPFVMAAFGQDAGAIEAGQSLRVTWANDLGGLRGSGVLARTGEQNFLLLSRDADTAWFENAAPRFPAAIRDETAEKAMLEIAGPLAFGVMAAAGLEAALALQPGQHSALVWRGLTVSLSRFSALGGWEVACAANDALEIFDRFERAGRLFGMAPAGELARETLLLEAGQIAPGLDYAPVRDRAALPSAEILGLNAGGPSVLTGILLDGAEPAAFTPVSCNGKEAGRTLRSAYSPTLRRAVAMAVLSRTYAQAGTPVRMTIAGARAAISGSVTPLPFVPAK